MFQKQNKVVIGSIGNQGFIFMLVSVYPPILSLPKSMFKKISMKLGILTQNGATIKELKNSVFPNRVENVRLEKFKCLIYQYWCHIKCYSEYIMYIHSTLFNYVVRLVFNRKDISKYSPSITLMIRFKMLKTWKHFHLF